MWTLKTRKSQCEISLHKRDHTISSIKHIMSMLQIIFSPTVLLVLFSMPAVTAVQSHAIRPRTVTALQDGIGGRFLNENFKKPLVPSLMVNSTGDSARRTVYVAPARNRGTNKRPALLGNGRLDINQTTCAPRLFRVRLESGNCSRRVLTKVSLVQQQM